MCITDGTLRARLDGELTQTESLSVDNHLIACVNCRNRLEIMSEQIDRVQTLFSALSPLPNEYPLDARIALNQFRTLREPARGRERAIAILATCRQFLTTSISIPVPLAAALVIAFSVLFHLAMRAQEPLNLQSAQSVRLPDLPKIVEIPVVREKVVTQTIYIESNNEKKRKTRSFLVQNLSKNRVEQETAGLNDTQITGKEFERMLRENERSLLERRTRYLKPSFGDPSFYRDLIIPPVIWQRDMFDNDFLAKPVNRTRLIANQQFNPNMNIRSGIDFSRPKTE
jgi:hypothetical protein